MIRLIGILIVVLGFIFKFDTISVVIVAALATALVSGISFFNFLEMLGDAFISNRAITLFLLTLPMIGILERYGLRNRAVYLINKIKVMTPGRLLTLYQFIREVAAFFSIRIQGHTQFIRPIIEPMVQASAIKEHGKIDENDTEGIKALSAASDNYGNFFAQNTFVASAGTLLIAQTLRNLGYDVSESSIARVSIPVAIIALILGAFFNYMFDKKLSRKYNKAKGESIK